MPTCVESMNNFTFWLGIFFLDPPENTTISNVTIDVEEGMSPPRISCAGNAYPPLQYQWLRNGDVKSDGPILHIYEAMTRADNGTYECISRNKHGNQSVTMTINILCKRLALAFMLPSCR